MTRLHGDGSQISSVRAAPDGFRIARVFSVFLSTSYFEIRIVPFTIGAAMDEAESSSSSWPFSIVNYQDFVLVAC